jgi:AraC-like DNA-binding protein
VISRGVHCFTFSDVDDLSRLDEHGHWKALPLRRYPLSLQIRTLDLAGMTLKIGRSTPLAVLGVLPADCAWVLFPLDGRRTLRLRGRPAGADAVAVFGPRAEYEMANRRDTSWALAILPAADVESVLALPRRSTLLRPGSAAWLRADATAWGLGASLMHDAAEIMEEDPDVFQVEEACRSLRASILDACHALFAGPEGSRPRSLAGAPATLRRIVRTADDYLAAHPSEAADTPRLAAAIGASETRLRLAFAAVLGISAARYLMMRRLMLVHAALHAPDRPWRPVADTARAHGFWDIRRFERGYRAMFGESPTH